MGLCLGEACAYEYEVDDGTAVIDCAHRVQRAPKKDKPHFADAKLVMRDMPKPVARIGLSVRVVGKVQRAYGTRQVQVDEIGELNCSV